MYIKTSKKAIYANNLVRPINIIENEIRPVTCTGSEDGLISVTVNGGNDNFYRNFIWEVLQENQSCTTYTIRLRDNDNDGIFDIIDADKNNDGILDEPGTDDNANGIIDDADNDTNYSFGIVRYQSCDGLDVKNNIITNSRSSSETITINEKFNYNNFFTRNSCLIYLGLFRLSH